MYEGHHVTLLVAAVIQQLFNVLDGNFVDLSLVSRNGDQGYQQCGVK